MENLIILEGIVQKGKNRGRKFGFPTINFPINPTIHEGIYLSLIEIKGNSFNALTFIGSAKTFDENVYQAETYVLDFAEDVYGQLVKVTLIKKLRDNQKFDSEEALIKQMEEDKKQAEEYFKNK